MNTFPLRKASISVNVGLGLTISHIQASANYNIACGKTGEASVVNAVKKYNGRNNNWQIALAYFF